jgi:hypothetical protein
MVSMPHPPYSLDLVLNGFYLCPTVKKRFEHASLTEEEQLFEQLHTILKSIPGEELERVFEAW